MVIELCSFCKKRPATKLCDAPIGTSRYIGHPPRYLMQKAKNYNTAWLNLQMQKTITCDRRICDHCATQVAAGIDYCPKCMERIRTAPTRYKRRTNT